jgi:hypothetical protein
MSPFVILEYIKNSIDILINLKVEERLESEKNINDNNFIANSNLTHEEYQNEYEVLLRKLESDIRTHIKIEHQLKLYSEGLQQRIEDLEKELENKTGENYNKNEYEYLKSIEVSKINILIYNKI